jgi:hypothetical protein
VGVSEEVKIEIKKPVEEVQVVELEPRVYRVIRSFVESSDKDEYPWNRGYRLGNTVIFVKEGKWQLEIAVSIPKEELDKCNADKYAVIVSLNRVLHVYRECGEYVISIKQYEFKFSDAYRVAFTSNVPFARPILLAEIISRISDYVSLP